MDNFYPYSYFSASREQSRHYQTNQYLQNHPHPLLHPPYAYSSYPAFRFNAAMGSIQQDMDEFQKLSNQYEPELEVWIGDRDIWWICLMIGVGPSCWPEAVQRSSHDRIR